MSFPLKVPSATAPNIMSTVVLSAFYQVYHKILFAHVVEMLNINL